MRPRRRPRHLIGLLVVLAMPLAVWSGTARAQSNPSLVDPFELSPPNAIDGIDVSHWQNTIDWAKVAGAGYRFAFHKATEGQTYEDPKYATNRTAANAAGLIVGAYHFARPDNTSNDATIEADHFTAVADPRSGDLLPVLDLEDSGGLSTSALITWVQTWLDRVRTTLGGAKPIIYTSPNFWETAMGDTTQFADEGYRLLWIAHWDVPEPSVPASNWGGNGWTFWQYTDCGSVPGISGCVDLDYLKASRRQYVRIH